MEGPNLRGCPRTFFCAPVEIRYGRKTIRLKRGQGDLGIRGVFLHTEALPLNTEVHICFTGKPATEMEGIVRYCDTEGIHIEFTVITEVNRRRLDDLIADFARKETLSR